MEGNVFNYVFLLASTVAGLGMLYCAARFIFGFKPSLASNSALGVLAGASIFGFGYFAATKISSPTLVVTILAGFLVASVLVCCAFVWTGARRHHAAQGTSVTAMLFGIISVPAVGLWLGMTLTAYLGNGIP